MVGTIAPVVHRNSPLSWRKAAAIYTLASIAGGGLTGALAGSIGAFLLEALGPYGIHLPLLLGLVAIAYALHELQVIVLPHPQRQKQVPSIWRNIYHPYITAGLFGFLLGAGFTTFIPTASYHILGLATILNGSPLLGALLFGVYGAARGALLWPFSHYTTNYEILTTFTRYMDVTKPLMRQFNGFMLGLIGAYWLLVYLSIAG